MSQEFTWVCLTCGSSAADRSLLTDACCVNAIRASKVSLRYDQAGRVISAAHMPHTSNKPCIVCEPVNPVWTPTPENIEKLFARMAHGDAEHRRWLRAHLYLFFGVAIKD